MRRSSEAAVQRGSACHGTVTTSPSEVTAASRPPRRRKEIARRSCRHQRPRRLRVSAISEISRAGRTTTEKLRASDARFEGPSGASGSRARSGAAGRFVLGLQAAIWLTRRPGKPAMAAGYATDRDGIAAWRAWGACWSGKPQHGPCPLPTREEEPWPALSASAREDFARRHQLQEAGRRRSERMPRAAFFWCEPVGTGSP